MPNAKKWVGSANLRLVKRVDPVYPVSAKAAGMKGMVYLAVDIGKDGHVIFASAEYGPGSPEMFREAAIKAVEQWVYQPVLHDGKPIEALTHVSVPFP